ncbi:glycerol-3-phosphate dehydrogenase [Methyloceanibacter caenitepidi]|uniref:glycerol-3-phosphate dehydrogenase n=1 Tax=Methyloceanibacter caenitepidi TaxID=1384459 RepID=UPI0005ED65C8|nr:glycerol-3-phosphate dehydrogenase [Methyloceanibacter caenitepidi]
MPSTSVDIVIVGGGIHGAAIARDAAGRGLKVMLAEREDYASFTSSASSKLAHGGLRYLEHMEFGLVRESLSERAGLLKTAPHLVSPLKFLLPVFDWQKRSAWFVHTGLALYDLLSLGGEMPGSGRLSQDEVDALPHLRRDHLKAVLHYHDAHADDARLTLSAALDARARGADVANRRAVTAIVPRENGYTVTISEGGKTKEIGARFIVNTAGPFVDAVDAMIPNGPSPKNIRFVRGSHIVLPMPDPPETCAYTLQDEGERIIFTIPWLAGNFLMIGTTDIPQAGAPGHAVCSAEEKKYLLDAYNRYFARAGGAATESDIVCDWAGLRTLHGSPDEAPSRITREVTLETATQGTGGFLSLVGGKLTTHRATAEQVLTKLQAMGLDMGPAWTKGVPQYGGTLDRDALRTRAEEGPTEVSPQTRRRWAFTYGDKIEYLFARMESDPGLAEGIVPGVPRVELEHAVSVEDASTGEDFLWRRTKLQLTLDDAARETIEDWFVKN